MYCSFIFYFLNKFDFFKNNYCIGMKIFINIYKIYKYYVVLEVCLFILMLINE